MWPAPCYSGILATAGALVFAGQSETKAGKAFSVRRSIFLGGSPVGASIRRSGRQIAF
jgi:hypothetical protein